MMYQTKGTSTEWSLLIKQKGLVYKTHSIVLCLGLTFTEPKSLDWTSQLLFNIFLSSCVVQDG